MTDVNDREKAAYEYGVNMGAYSMVIGLQSMIDEGGSLDDVATEISGMLALLGDILPEGTREEIMEAALAIESQNTEE